MKKRLRWLCAVDRMRTGELLAAVMVAVTAVVFGADWRGEELQLWADQGTMGGCYLLLVSAAADRRVKERDERRESPWRERSRGRESDPSEGETRER